MSDTTQFQNLIFDVSNVFHRAYHASQASSPSGESVEGVSKTAIQSFFNILRRVEKEFLEPGGTCWFLFDNSSSGENRRKEIDPGYKADRKPKDVEINSTIDALHFLLLHYSDSYCVVKKEGKEADDLVKPVLETLQSGTQAVVSNDLDWAQNIADSTLWIRYRTQDQAYEVLNREDFREEHGFYPDGNNLLMFKAVRGDSSDGIPVSVPRLPRETLLYITQTYGDPESLLQNLKEDERISDLWKERIRENNPRLRLNFKLVSPDPVGEAEFWDSVYRSEFSPRVLYNLYRYLGIKISSFDPRVMSFFPQPEVSTDNFFGFRKTPRA